MENPKKVSNIVMILVMEVFGSGKTTVGEMLARRLGFQFVDADDFHSPANKTKMSKGIPLRDADRLSQRKNRFFNENLLQSQLEKLQKPNNAVCLDASKSPEEIVELAFDKLEGLPSEN